MNEWTVGGLVAIAILFSVTFGAIQCSSIRQKAFADCMVSGKNTAADCALAVNKVVNQ